MEINQLETKAQASKSTRQITV